LKGKHKACINVFGIITLHDIDMLERKSRTGCGWIACTTNAVFLAAAALRPDHRSDLLCARSPRHRAAGPATRHQGAVRCAGPLAASQPCASPGAT